MNPRRTEPKTGDATVNPGAILGCLLVAFALMSCGAGEGKGSLAWEPVPAGMVLTRNFMVPESPKAEGYFLLGASYKLGSKAYGRMLPSWWLKLVAEARVGEKWHPKEFPLAYAGEFTSKDGTKVLLVVQTSQAFTGDGFWSPGPVVYLVARLFTHEAAGPKLIKEEAFSIGSFQFTRLMAGEAKGREVSFKTESGSSFDSRDVTHSETCTIRLDENNQLTKKGQDHF